MMELTVTASGAVSLVVSGKHHLLCIACIIRTITFTNPVAVLKGKM
jgi:hypothetical protein